jgi:hypothetical protein
MNIENAILFLAKQQDNQLYYRFNGFINNETDFNNITVEDNKSFNFSWSDVQAKATELENEKTTKDNAQVSGNQKLLDLGLTQAEATALTGYTPPVAE